MAPIVALCLDLLRLPGLASRRSSLCDDGLSTKAALFWDLSNSDFCILLGGQSSSPRLDGKAWHRRLDSFGPPHNLDRGSQRHSLRIEASDQPMGARMAIFSSTIGISGLIATLLVSLLYQGKLINLALILLVCGLLALTLFRMSQKSA